MNRRIAVSCSAARRLEWAQVWLHDLDSRAGVLVVAPTRGAADDFTRFTAASGAGLFGVHRYTPLQLASELAASRVAEAGLAPVSGVGAEALAVRVSYAMRTEGKLQYFAPVADTPGFARALVRTLSELRLMQVSGQRLAEAGSAAQDLSVLLASYRGELMQRSLADSAALYDLAAAVVSNQQHRLLGLPLLLLDPDAAYGAEAEFLRALALRAPSVAATAPAGDDLAIRAIERLLGTTHEMLDDAAQGRTIERVQRDVFASGTLEPQQTDDTIEFFSASGEGLECVEIARRIRRFGGEGTPFDRMAILLRNPRQYLPLVEDALRRADIPGYFTRESARPDPAGRAFLALLKCAAEHLSASAFAEYLSLGQTPALEPDGGPIQRELPWTPPTGIEEDGQGEPSDPPEETDESAAIAGTLRTPFGWEQLLVDAAVVGGHGRWARRLDGLESELRLQLEELDRAADDRRHALERQIGRLRILRRFALPVIEALDSLPREAAWGEWLDGLRNLAGLALRSPEGVLSTLAELEPMAAVGPVMLDEVREALSDRLRFLIREPPPRRYGDVLVASIPEARGRSFDVVFLPGLAEGVFPRRTAEDPLLLDETRRTLDCGLPTNDERVAVERALLRVAAGAATRKLVVSYPRIDVMQGRQRVPSFYALEIMRAAEGVLPDLRQLEDRAEQAAPSRLTWPAPEDASEAIDDAEYDLARLQPVLQSGKKHVRGQARYLMLANANLARSLRARARRWRSAWSAADGLVQLDPATLDVLQRERLSARVYSPSALQHFAACPYRFFLSAIQGLRVHEGPAPVERLDPLTRGALFHAVQFDLFQKLKEANLLPLREQNRTAVLDLADRVFDDSAQAWQEELAPAIGEVWKTEIERLRVDVRAWLREAERIHQTWQPLHFELAFGLASGPGRDRASLPETVEVLEKVRLRGSIDLVERRADGSALRVTDHKTGKALSPQPAWVGKGEVLQPALYALAAEKILQRPVAAGVLYYCTQRGNYSQLEIEIGDQTRSAAARVLDTIDESIAEGFLPAAPRKDACLFCDYRPVCGPYEELRTARKRKDRLEKLFEIRSMP